MLMAPALTMWAASHVPVYLDTPEMDSPAQVSLDLIFCSHHNYREVLHVMQTVPEQCHRTKSFKKFTKNVGSAQCCFFLDIGQKLIPEPRTAKPQH